LSYVLMHSSGEWISGELEMNPVKNDPQGIGSAITYARRYTLAGIAGIATEDDDGNAASGKDAKAKGDTNQRRQESTVIGPKPELPKPNDTTYITADQLKDFHALRNRHNWSEDDAKKMLKDFGVFSSKNILRADYDKICGYIRNGSYADYLDFKTNAPA